MGWRVDAADDADAGEGVAVDVVGAVDAAGVDGECVEYWARGGGVRGRGGGGVVGGETTRARAGETRAGTGAVGQG